MIYDLWWYLIYSIERLRLAEAAPDRLGKKLRLFRSLDCVDVIKW